MPSSSVAELQQKLFKRMGLGVSEQRQERKPRNGKAYSRQPALPGRPTPVRDQRHGRGAGQQQSGPKSILKTSARPRTAAPESDAEEEPSSLDEDDELDDLGEGGEQSDDDDEDEDGSSGEEFGSSPDVPGKTSARDEMPKAAREKIDQDDAEIAAFERKLGIKKGRKSLPQSFKDDGLDELMGDLNPEVDESEDDEPSKRKRDYDDWLSSKRRKTDPQSKASRSYDEENSVDELDNDSTDAESDVMGNDEFEGFDSDADDVAPAPPRQRENPYTAPTSGPVVAKYVPPSLRKAAGSEAEAHSRLAKQVQGLINRLTDANILSIVHAVDELYQKNARGDVTEILTDAVLAQICKPESLPDQFFVLTGGFAAAVYKITGSSFGSHLVRRIVKDFGNEYDKAVQEAKDGELVIRKEASNVITFLSQLYVFEVVSCKIVFDYMERLLSDLTEVNVELLLRICRMAGRLLRRDDPQTLKHVSSVLSKEVLKVGYANISARTKFMVETIDDLGHSKPKARGMDSTVVSEHVLRMKKRLGELKSQSRRLDGLAPMGMSLEDVEGAETKGKWWLVGASVPVKQTSGSSQATGNTTHGDGSASFADDEDMDFILPDYPSKARAQGLNTAAQISIFTALMSAMNYEHGYRQFMNLKLKKDDQLEIARVLVQCVGSETQYNEYYALVARQASSNGRVRFAVQNRLWKIFRCLGESLFGEDPEDDETAEGERMKEERRMSNVARFYASLIADGVLSIAILKPLDLPEANSWTAMLIERLMIDLLRECRSKVADDEDARVNKVFGAARDLPVLAAGVHWFLRKRVRRTKLVGAKEVKRLERVSAKAQAAVQAADE